ncbi:MAG: serine/threonine-protein kinase [Candidatus Sericytochromatia bacterium]
MGLTEQSSIINNNYKIIKLLGSGGMGNVYLAEDLKLDRLVALKTLKSQDNSDVDREYIERFKNEAKSIAKLTHPNIVNIYDIGSCSEFDYMAMEYVEGDDLYEVLQKKKLSIGSVIKIAKQLCEVVSFVHSKGILHRDIKTSNILVGENYNIKLTDFGIAKKDSNTDQAMLTQAGTILGSILYSPPEQFINVKSLNERSDLYSVAVCIYEMLTGVPPFADKNNIQEIIMAIMTEKITPPSECSDKIPVFFDDILIKALNKDPDKRYNDVAEMLKDIEFVEKNFITSDTPNSNLLSRDFLRSTLNHANIRDTRIISQLDLTNTTLSIGDFIKGLHLNLSWLHKALSEYETNNEELYYSDVIEKIRAKSLNGRRFSGVIANNTIYLFVHEGVIIGAFNIEDKTFGNSVFDTISGNTIFNKIINTRKDDNINILLYSTLTLDGECIKNNLNSSHINLFEILDELNTDNTKFSGQVVCQLSKETNNKDKYVFVYNNGNIVLSLKVSNDHSLILDDLSLEDFLKQGNITVNIYKPKLIVPTKELENIMYKSEFILTINWFAFF